METLRNVLLVFLLILLVYVLYRRLLSLLGKKKKNESYAEVKSWMFSENLMTLNITLRLPNKESIRLEVFDLNDQLKREHKTDVLEKGIHTLSENLTNLSKGRYYYKLITSNHEISHYFEVK